MMECSCEKCSRTRRLHRLHHRLLFVFVSVLLLAAKSSTQDTDEDFYFSSDLPDYYYVKEPLAIEVPCEAFQQTEEGGPETAVVATVFKNSEPIDMYASPDRHFITANDDGIANGLLVVPSRRNDSGCAVRCAIIRDGREVASTSVTTVYVGDGSPIAPISETIQSDETLTTVTIDWGKSPVPDDAPLRGYNVNVTQIIRGTGERLNTVQMQTEDNDTSAILYHLIPGAEYEVVIAGRNSVGEGEKSRPVIVASMKPLVPPPPEEVEAELEVTPDEKYIIVVTWTPPELDFETMTPIDNFTIFYHRSKEPFSLRDSKNISTTTNTTRTLTITGLTGAGDYMVGVVAVNSAGQSSVEYTTESIALPSVSSSLLTTTHIIIIAAVAGSLFLLLCITVFIVLICVLRIRTKKLERERAQYDFDDPNGHLDNGSPYSKKRGSPKSKKKMDNGRPVLTNSINLSSSGGSSELHNLEEYGLEPRRAGSQSPPPSFDSIVNGQTLNSSSTFQNS